MMRLQSDFRDYYDHAFSREGSVFSRNAGDRSLHKLQQFAKLIMNGYLVPPYGPVREILGQTFEGLGRAEYVVAYKDIYAHRAEGKALLTLASLLFPEDLDIPCSAFVGNPYARPAASLRELYIGKRCFLIEYQSDESWMSNYGEGSCQVVGRGPISGTRRMEYPLYAVDLVYGQEAYAVDLNTAPGIRGSGVERLLGPDEVVEALEEYCK